MPAACAVLPADANTWRSSTWAFREMTIEASSKKHSRIIFIIIEAVFECVLFMQPCFVERPVMALLSRGWIIVAVIPGRGLCGNSLCFYPFGADRETQIGIGRHYFACIVFHIGP